MLSEFKIFYDGDCPVCTNYAAHQMLMKSFHNVEIVNLRGLNEKQLAEVKKTADPDEGIIIHVVVDSKISVLQGADALSFIAGLTESKNKRFTLWGLLDRVVENKKIATKVYPLLFWLRLQLLKILRINPKFDDKNTPI